MMRWLCLKRGQQSRSCHQTSSLPVCVPKYAASVSNLSCLCKLGIVLTRNLIHDPFLLFSWYWVFHLHQHLSHCSEDNLQLGGSTYAFAGFFNLLWHPFTYGRHKTCTLLSSVSLSFTVSSSSLSLSSSFLSLGSWSPPFLTCTSFLLLGDYNWNKCMVWCPYVHVNRVWCFEWHFLSHALNFESSWKSHLNQIGGKRNYVVLPCRIYFIQCNIHCSSVLCYDRYWWSDIFSSFLPFPFSTPPLLPSSLPPLLYPLLLPSSTLPLPLLPFSRPPFSFLLLPIYLLPFFLSPSGLNQVFPHDLPKFTTGKYHILCIICPWVGHLSASWKRGVDR